MKAKELRIGNLITDEFYESFKTIIEVESINESGINLEIQDDGRYPEVAKRWIEPYHDFDELRPIPLTEEWLLKFGKLQGATEYGTFEMRFDLRTMHLFEGVNFAMCDRISWKPILYVHELQNLMFVLTGEELTI